jgi:hypothetical protein
MHDLLSSSSGPRASSALMSAQDARGPEDHEPELTL